MGTYKVLSHVEHVLRRPGMYVGSTALQPQDHYVIVDGVLRKTSLVINPALYKLFDEVLANAFDQSVLDPSLKNVRINVDERSISVENDGQGIPVTPFEGGSAYIPEVIFGTLLSGSNFDDTGERYTGGQNGLGVKLCNVFSESFTVECADGERVFSRTWTRNMGAGEGAAIKDKKTKPFVRITFTPDFTLFSGVAAIDEQHMELFKRRAMDLNALSRSSLRVTFNGEKLSPLKDFCKYVALFGKEPLAVYKSERWDVAVCKSDNGYGQVSFVNGINTHLGGTHVEYVANFVCGEVIEMFDQKNKKRAGSLKSSFVRDKLFFLIRCDLPNPTFSSQTKEQCTLPMRGVRDLPVINVSKIYKEISDDILEDLDAKDRKQLAKTDGKKTERIAVPKLDDARWAGTTRSEKCTLIITEGDSARTFAIAGLSSVDRAYYGVFPLRGKLLNVRDATVSQIQGNSEIASLKQILGLKQDRTYSSVKELRYGRLMILTDQDLDGHHIKGLVMNWIDTFWPELFGLGFACSMFTPIVKAFRGADVRSYYSVPDFEKDQAEGKLMGYRVKYYKGLGTSTATEAKEYFADIHKNTLRFEPDDDTREALSKAFKKDRADDRKRWILENTGRKDFTVNNRSVTRFVNDELVQFSIYDNERSIPHVMDGLKPSQRKILHTVLEKCPAEEVKVAQLAPRVAEFTHYHHGEQSLVGAVVNMAQDFVGSNQVNVLLPKGQFGTRLNGGKDAASARYIYTQLNPVAKELFPERDTSLLPFEYSDGHKVEPKYFAPVLPLVLVNGASGIGTGFSTHVPTYSLDDVVENVKRCLRGDPLLPMHPSFDGFRGVISEKHDGKYEVRGAWTFEPRRLIVKDLPLGVWTDAFKESLDSLGYPYVNKSTESVVLFEVDLPEGVTEEQMVAKLPLKKQINTGNMYLFDTEGRIRRYEDPLEIVREFVRTRLALYERRRLAIIDDLGSEIESLEAKVRFLELVIAEAIVVFRRSRADVLGQIRERFLPPPYDAYLATKIDEFTTDRVDALKKQAEDRRGEKRRMESTAAEDMFGGELAACAKRLRL